MLAELKSLSAAGSVPRRDNRPLSRGLLLKDGQI
jgi:hypothetical protein